MDKNAIKRYAVWARRELIDRVSTKAKEFGITEEEIVPASADSIKGHLLTKTQKAQRTALIEQISKNGYKQVIEGVAYTWFNRFSALRFMEVNGYLPTHIRVFTDEENNFKPQILAEAIHLELDGLQMDKVYELKQENKTEDLFKYLIITQCNALGNLLPGLFQKIDDYTEILFPDNLLREGSVIQQMIEVIPEKDWTHQVQIIGWMYQYYNDDVKAQVDANVKKGSKVSKTELGAKTQIFTPDWVVRYMVENSLGRLWLNGHPDDELKSEWKYYLDEANQEPDVQILLGSMHNDYKNIQPQDIKVYDPCMGSGHMLVYAFDVLMQIYKKYGISERDAAQSILQNNLYGLDIDDRASQLAYFAVMMKARQYDRRILFRGIQPNIYSIAESNKLNINVVDYFINNDPKLKQNFEKLMRSMIDAKEYGSLINIPQIDFATLYLRVNEIRGEISLFKDSVIQTILPIIQVAEVMNQKYDIVITNPPYMGNGDMNAKLSTFVQENYPTGKSDLYSAFMLKCRNYLNKHGFQAMVTMQSWMNLGAFEAMRKNLCQTQDIMFLWHLDDTLLGIAYQTAAFILRASKHDNYRGTYDIAEKDIFAETILTYQMLKGEYKSKQDSYLELDGCPIAYALGDKCIEAYTSADLMSTVLVTREGMTTGNNDLFLRLWFEVDKNKRNSKWFPYNKGGDYRKWYGNDEYYVNWENEGFEIRTFKDEQTGRIRSHNYNGTYSFCDGITWSAFSSRGATFRYSNAQFLFDSKGSKGFCTSGNLKYILAFLNSSVCEKYLQFFAGAKDKKPGHIIALPYKFDLSLKESIECAANECISISKVDWDSDETSWDFAKHPLIPSTDLSNKNGTLISKIYCNWSDSITERFSRLKELETTINKMFIDIYGVQGEVLADINDNDVTIRHQNLERDIRSFISYAVGCMFGRYSLDEDGLILAGEDFGSKFTYATVPLTGTGITGSPSSFTYAQGDCYLRKKDSTIQKCSFAPDKDNILPICDDEYFEDDIVGKFVRFVATVYGDETLEENLRFIAEALGGKGAPREVIRNYFLNDFYNDHLKIYQKRPIYWQFDSGKKNGFKCLIYMHRYQPDTIARIRTDYVHEQQARYRTAIAGVEQRIANASTAERVRLNKQLIKLKDQETEIHAFEEKIHHLADQMIRIDLDDGVKHNYEIFKDVLTKIK